MKKISIETEVEKAYEIVNGNVISLKSCIINLCSDIDRYFRLKFKIDI